MRAKKKLARKRSSGCFILCFLLSICCPILGQQNALTEQETNKKLYEVFTDKITSNGGVFSFYKRYQGANDSLFLQSTRTNNSLGFKEGHSAKFSSNSDWFSCQTPGNKLHLVNLKKDFTLKNIDDVIRFDFSSSGNYLICLQQNEQGEQHLRLEELAGSNVSSIRHVVDYRLYADHIIVIGKKDSLSYVATIRLEDSFPQKMITISDKLQYGSLELNSKAKAFTFLGKESKQGNSPVLYYYQFGNRLKVLEPSNFPHFFKTRKIHQPDFYNRMVISDDGRRIFFPMENTQEKFKVNKYKDLEAEMWHYKDPWEYPRKEEYERIKNTPLIAVWWPENDELFQVSGELKNQVILTGNQKAALSYDPFRYEPQYDFNAPLDIYITDLETKKERLLLKKFPQHYDWIRVSPGGRYVSYFKNRDWWVYDLKLNQRYNLTDNLPSQFYNQYQDMPGEAPPYGQPGWLADDEGLLLYDEYDIWCVHPTGRSAEKLTDGRKRGIRYRFPNKIVIENQPNRKAASGFQTRIYNLKKPELIKVFNMETYSSGYAFWDGQDIQEIVNKECKVGNMLIDQDFSTFIYKEESFDQPERLLKKEKPKEGEQILLDTYPGFNRTEWGKAELISYESSGKRLKGALYYPKKFETGKLYPMIVKIYEHPSKGLNEFVNLEENDGTGFNVAEYTQDDYIVLYADLAYETGKPGSSATQSVLSAIKAVEGLGIVDVSKIGLIGHSFGGYETSYIISETKLFKTAVSGAPYTDMVSWYHSIGWNNGRSEIWRFEKHQQRMGISFAGNKQGYYENSPVHRADSIETPLLLWAGKKDEQVPWSQSIELFLALKRLDKQVAMLVFPEEGHVLREPQNKEYLSGKIKEWFDYFLKNKPPKEWINNGHLNSK